MKKIMFEDTRFRLEQAVLDGRKNMTRRVVPFDDPELGQWNIEGLTPSEIEKKYLPKSTYKVGDKVAIAQRYLAIRSQMKTDEEKAAFEKKVRAAYDGKEFNEIEAAHNKSFAKSQLMPHHIEITKVSVERLQEITWKEAVMEGVIMEIEHGKDDMGNRITVDLYRVNGINERFTHPVSAFIALINRISPKLFGLPMWDANPLVYVYSFKLID